MAVLQMQNLRICALKKDRSAVLGLLQAAGVVQITQEAEDDGVFKRSDTMSFRQIFEKNALMADQALDILEEYAPEKKSLLSALEGKALTESNKMRMIAENASSILEDAEHILALSKQIAEDKAGIVRMEAQIESLAPWMKLDVPVRCGSTERTALLIGTIGSVLTLEELSQALAGKVPSAEAVDLQIVGGDKDQTCIAAVCLKKDEGILEDGLRALGFARPPQLPDEIPARYAESLQAQTEALEKDILAAQESLKACEPRRGELRLLSDYFRVRAQKYEVMGTILQSDKTFLVTGYVPKESVPKLEKKLTRRFELAFEAEDAGDGEEVPVVLKNPKFNSCAEGITQSFGLPARGEIDPTSIMSVCYIILFGLMLSDAAYGVIVSVCCFWVLKRYPRMGSTMNKTIHLFMYCGLSTVFWGVLFGGYFGDAVEIIGKTFFGKSVAVPALWFVPLHDPMRMLLYAMILGVIHMFLGLGIKGYMHLKNRRYLDFFCDVVLWYMMLTGLVLILIPTELFGSIVQIQVVFPASVHLLAKILAIAGAAGILLMSGRDSKNPVLRVALGAYDLYNITGWLSDVLSYSRLLALGLATGVIASVVNQMGSMFGSGILGAVLFAIVFVFGHLFNMAINLLGAYVHTCRLQYVEFFGKFYEGGGREFLPFKQNTKYVDIKED